MLMLSGCVAGAPAARTETGATESVKPSNGAPRILKTAWVREPVEGIALFGGSGDVGFQVTSMFHMGLTAYDGQGTLIPRLARKVPSIADGDWVVSPDGSM